MPKLLFPPVRTNAQGQARRVGVELEFGGVDIPTAAQVVLEAVGGKMVEENPYRICIEGTEWGDFEVEFDARVLSEGRFQKVFERFGIDAKAISLGEQSLEDQVGQWLESAIALVLPYEVISPPMLLEDFDRVEVIREGLRQRQAKGTFDTLHYAFGTHLNPEAPARNLESILRHLKAFLLLYPRLREEGNVDPTRSMSPFIKPFPPEYQRLVLDPTYHPGWERFLGDYHAYNPDRNRPLDLYPLLAALQPDRMAAFDDLGKVSPRPTYHYRLPNSRIDEPGWTVTEEWNRWVSVEALADDREALAEMIDAWRSLREDNWWRFEEKWLEALGEGF
jgi:hypothetical protein